LFKNVFDGCADFRSIAIDYPDLLALFEWTTRHYLEQNALLGGRIIEHFNADCFGLPEIRQQPEFVIYFRCFHGKTKSAFDVELIAARAPGERVRKRIILVNHQEQIFERVIYENSMRNLIEHDFVIVPDPQPLQLLKDKKLREEIGRKGRETVREEFLLTRLCRALPQSLRWVRQKLLPARTSYSRDRSSRSIRSKNSLMLRGPPIPLRRRGGLGQVSGY